MALILLALVLRLAYVVEISAHPLYRRAGLDEELYFRDAMALLEGHGPDLPFWRPPGVTLALAGTLALFGPGVLAPRLVIAILSTLACGLLYLLARRHASHGEALAALGLLALNGPLIQMSGEIKDTAWVLVLDLLGMMGLIDSRRGGRASPLFAAGVAFGLSALFRPLILLFLPVAAVWLLRERAAPTRWRSVALLALGAALPLTPVALLNNTSGESFVLVSTNGGMNLFIGNNPDYRRTVVARPGSQWTAAVLRPALSAGFVGAGRAQEAWFQKTALSFVREQPRAAVGLFARKLSLFFNGHEIPRDTDIYLDAESFSTLRPFVWRGPVPLPMGVLLPLAVIGLVLGVRRRQDLALPALFVWIQAIAVSAFLVTSRYRIPSLPLLCLFSVVGAHELWRHTGRYSAVRRSAGALVLAALVLLLNRPTFETRQSLRAERFFLEGNALRLQGDEAAAEACYRAAARLDSTDTRALQVLGEMRVAAGDLTDAIDIWRRIVRFGPYNLRDRDRLQSLLLNAGDRQGALQALEDDIRATGALPERRAELFFRRGVLEYELGRFDPALASLDSAIALAPEIARESLRGWIDRAGPPASDRGAAPISPRDRAWSAILRRAVPPPRP